MNRRLIVPVIAGLAAIGALAACGGDDSPGDTPVVTSAPVTTTPVMTDDSMTDDSMTDSTTG